MSRLDIVIASYQSKTLYWMPNVFAKHDAFSMQVSLDTGYVKVPYTRYLVGHGPRDIYVGIYEYFF